MSILQPGAASPVDGPERFPVLIAEDNGLLRQILLDLVTAAGHPAEAVADGEKALERIDDGGFSILLTDWEMPGLEGTELCRRVRDLQKERYVYIVLVTSRGGEQNILAGLEAGADEYLVKPVNPAALTARLKVARRILALERSLKASLAQVTRLSLRDPLTDLYNRRYLAERLPQEIKRAERYGRPLAVLLADLDHFKQINDRYGHAVGDQVLREFSRQLESALRDGLDWAVRYGGEEFAVVLPETGPEGAAVVAERIRERLSGMALRQGEDGGRVTASFGIAGLEGGSPRPGLPMEALLEAADRRLYRAKAAGRDRICTADEEILTSI